MKFRMGVVFLAAGVCGSAWASEPGCYRTAEAAATQTGTRGVDGYRLEGRQRDVFSGAVWATVKSCAHPERPGVLVMAAGELGRVGGVAAPRSEAAAMVLVAGAKVTLVATEDNVRIEMPGVAQGSGALGDAVRVRLLVLTAEGGERFAEGIVRGRDLVEMVTR